MFFESEYRRQAMEKWHTSKAETKREISEDWRRSSRTFTGVVDRLQDAFVSLFPYLRSHNRY